MKNVPPLAESILVAIVAGTYLAGNDVRALDALARRGLVRFVRADVISDKPGCSNSGRSIEVTQAGLLAVRNDARAVAWVRANGKPSAIAQMDLVP